MASSETGTNLCSADRWLRTRSEGNSASRLLSTSSTWKTDSIRSCTLASPSDRRTHHSGRQLRRTDGFRVASPADWAASPAERYRVTKGTAGTPIQEPRVRAMLSPVGTAFLLFLCSGRRTRPASALPSRWSQTSWRRHISSKAQTSVPWMMDECTLATHRTGILPAALSSWIIFSTSCSGDAPSSPASLMSLTQDKGSPSCLHTYASESW